MDRVLVFPCGSEIGLEVFRSLQFEKNIQLWGGSSVPSNHGKYLFKNYIEGIPFVTNEDFIPALNEILKRNTIDYIFPAMDSVVLELSKNQDRLAAKVIGSPHETNSLCISKLETYRLFKDKIPVPAIYTPEQLTANPGLLPVFLKPDRGYGSRGTCQARTAAEVSFYLEQDSSLLILEYLPGREYTVECFTDFERKLKFVGGRERMRIQNGISVHSEEKDHPDFWEIAHKINDTLEFRGVWFFQVKESKNGDLVLMEIAARVAGTMALFRNKGVNLPLLSIYDAQGIAVDIIPNAYRIEIDRALTNRFNIDCDYDYVYVDFDDCIVINGRLNTTLVMFLYQCINNKKKIILLSKHRGDLESRLKENRLADLFDEIIHINEDDFKGDYIKHRPAIFIDDAFSERAGVARHTGVPVFDLSAVESLIDWRR
ncbi:MAG: ATP-grasp domain-containing protein [bacterium]|nr:ATP-grasp domain-containing protein [bacterium]